MREVAIVQAVLWSKVLRIRRRSRIWEKHLLRISIEWLHVFHCSPNFWMSASGMYPVDCVTWLQGRSETRNYTRSVTIRSISRLNCSAGKYRAASRGWWRHAVGSTNMTLLIKSQTERLTEKNRSACHILRGRHVAQARSVNFIG